MSKDKCSKINENFNGKLTFDHFELLCNLINNQMIKYVITNLRRNV